MSKNFYDGMSNPYDITELDIYDSLPSTQSVEKFINFDDICGPSGDPPRKSKSNSNDAPKPSVYNGTGKTVDLEVVDLTKYIRYGNQNTRMSESNGGNDSSRNNADIPKTPTFQEPLTNELNLPLTPKRTQPPSNPPVDNRHDGPNALDRDHGNEPPECSSQDILYSQVSQPVEEPAGKHLPIMNASNSLLSPVRISRSETENRLSSVHKKLGRMTCYQGSDTKKDNFYRFMAFEGRCPHKIPADADEFLSMDRDIKKYSTFVDLTRGPQPGPGNKADNMINLNVVPVGMVRPKATSNLFYCILSDGKEPPLEKDCIISYNTEFTEEGTHYKISKVTDRSQMRSILGEYTKYNFPQTMFNFALFILENVDKSVYVNAKYVLSSNGRVVLDLRSLIESVSRLNLPITIGDIRNASSVTNNFVVNDLAVATQINTYTNSSDTIVHAFLCYMAPYYGIHAIKQSSILRTPVTNKDSSLEFMCKCTVTRNDRKILCLDSKFTFTDLRIPDQIDIDRSVISDDLRRYIEQLDNSNMTRALSWLGKLSSKGHNDLHLYHLLPYMFYSVTDENRFLEALSITTNMLDFIYENVGLIPYYLPDVRRDPNAGLSNDSDTDSSFSDSSAQSSKKNNTIYKSSPSTGVSTCTVGRTSSSIRVPLDARSVIKVRRTSSEEPTTPSSVKNRTEDPGKKSVSGKAADRKPVAPSATVNTRLVDNRTNLQQTENANGTTEGRPIESARRTKKIVVPLSAKSVKKVKK